MAKVAIGAPAEVILQGAPAEEFERIRAFRVSAYLPACLADIGIAEATDEKLRIVGERACLPGEIMHNEAVMVMPGAVVRALRKLA